MKKILLLVFALTLVNLWTGSADAVIRSDELLDALPDGNVVAVVDLQKITASSFWANLGAQEKFKSSIDKAHGELADFGLKLSDLSSMALVVPSGSVNGAAVAMTGRFEQNDLLARLRSNGKVKLTSEKYKGYDLYKVQSIASGDESKSQPEKASQSKKSSVKKSEAALVFYGSNTLVSGSVEAVRASIDVKTGAKPGILQNAKLSDALAQNAGAAIRFAMTLTSSMTAGLQSGEMSIPDFSSISLIFGGVDFTSGLDLNATLRTDSAEHAKSMAERLGGLLSMAAGYLGGTSDPKKAPIGEALKSVKITSLDADIKITGSIPIELLNSLLSSLGQK